MKSLFEEAAPATAPLAARVRPKNLDEYIGQSHLVGQGKPLRIALEKQALHSMILWGPPGVGKTTFAQLMAEAYQAEFITLSAVLSGVKDIRAAIDQAKSVRAQYGRDTILFIDEVHRFNKSQQDAFLPFVEDGSIVFVGATTENPSFELNNALLSRARVYMLKSLSPEQNIDLLKRAIVHPAGFPDLDIEVDEGCLELIARAADGDGRKALNILEVAVDLSDDVGTEPDCKKVPQRRITREVIAEVVQTSLRNFDKGGDAFYEQISALHKSVRGSDPDAALYWFVRMIDGGCDPLYVARRVVRMASEDIGNADPRALQLALNAWDVQQRLGSPEGELTIAQAILYLAVAPKSNAVYKAYNQCRADVELQPGHEVPLHLRNAPSNLMKEAGYGEEYRYAHDEPDAFAAGENYFPEALKGTRYYQPVERGLEIKISEKLEKLRKLNQSSSNQRYR